MKRIYVVIGTNGILQSIGPVGGAVTRNLAEQIATRQEWKLDTSKVLAVDIAENDVDVLRWSE